MKKIGYTSGVFDLFHVGHLNILKKAKEQCDYLIVAVSTDDLAEEYKKKRPIICFEERKEIIQAIKYVDKVVEQTTLDKYSAWKQYGFDILFHGSDWKGDALYNRFERELKKVGVETVYINYTPSISTTIIRERIIEQGRVQ